MKPRTPFFVAIADVLQTLHDHQRLSSLRPDFPCCRLGALVVVRARAARLDRFPESGLEIHTWSHFLSKNPHPPFPEKALVLQRKAVDLVALEVAAGRFGAVLVEPGKARAIEDFTTLGHALGEGIGMAENILGQVLRRLQP